MESHDQDRLLRQVVFVSVCDLLIWSRWPFNESHVRVAGGNADDKCVPRLACEQPLCWSCLLRRWVNHLESSSAKVVNLTSSTDKWKRRHPLGLTAFDIWFEILKIEYPELGKFVIAHPLYAEAVTHTSNVVNGRCCAHRSVLDGFFKGV